MRKYIVVFVSILISTFGSAEESILDRLYHEAAIAWLSGDSRSAVHAWYKYLELSKRLELNNNSSQIEEVESNYREGRKKIEPPSQSKDAPPKDAPPAEFSKQKVRKNRSPLVRRLNKTRTHLPNLLARAEKEKAAGRFENAQRLCRLALQIEPESFEAKAKLNDLTELMEGK